MSITLFYDFLKVDGFPCTKKYEGVKDVTFVNGRLSFRYFDKYISDFRCYSERLGRLLYFTVDNV